MDENDKLSKQNSSQNRSVSRLYAVQALFQMEANNISMNKVVSEFRKYRIGSNCNHWNRARLLISIARAPLAKAHVHQVGDYKCQK